MDKNFVVYRSSAGSGKTTTLVKEYLKLSLKNPENFRHILAITFTNKAANEMKSRILENLTEIVGGHFAENRLLELVSETGLPEEKLVVQARRLLYNITHHYDEFSVSTIDSFVHQIVRTFSTDLKLPQGFEVLIDQDDIVPYIVEDIYDKLGRDKAFTNILLEYVLSQVNDEKSYNLNKNLTEFTINQLGEADSNAGNPEKLSPAEFLEKIKRLRKNIENLKTSIRKLAKESLEAVKEAGLSPYDFSGKDKGSVGSYLLKVEKWPAKPTDILPKAKVLKAIEEDVWYAKNLEESKKSRIDNLKPVLKDNLETIREKAHRYLFLRLVYNNIYEMALIGEIRKLFSAFTERTRKVHISEFNKRIHNEIAGQPVPFIYERLGRRYKYFLIDEFQDTSVLQWENLLPLIEESLANGHFNMLVGDAKQSIYRFRHGEVELFTHLPRLYGVERTPENQQREQVLEQNFNPRILNINYRSCRQIIDFNNRFFRFAGSTLKGDFQAVYEDVEQLPPDPPRPGGKISIDFVPAENADSFRTARLDKILEIVRQLREKAVPFQDICILTLKNDSASDIAAHLLQHHIPVVTSESLLLTTSPAVRLTAAVMKLLTDNKNQLWLGELLSSLLELFQTEDSFYQLFKKAKNQDSPLQYLLEHFGILLPSPEVLRTRSVYEIATEIMRRLPAAEIPDPFMLFFLDFVFEKEPLYYGSLPAFLQLWEEKKSKQNIVFPEGLNSVQIMTVHKAKGLKFNIVIADLHEFKNNLTHKQYWENTEVPELEGISPVLLKITKVNLAAIGREEIYLHEQAKTRLDFLNKIYVAFTRAVNGLYIIGSRIKTKDYFSELLLEYLKKTEGEENTEKLHYAWGSLPESPETVEDTPKAEELVKNFSVPWYDYLDIAPVEESYWEALSQDTPRAYGKLVHSLLANIKVEEDIHKQVTAGIVTGLFNREEAAEMETLLKIVVKHPDIQPYFSREAIVKNETELYDTETGTFKRPDRVVITNGKLTILDYKTGERDPKREHRYFRQVEDYASLYRKMGYENIEKKLVYLHEGNVEVVTVD